MFKHLRADKIQRDIRDNNIVDLFDDIEYVFHLAAKNSVIDCENDPIETYSINLDGTTNIFNASLKKM